MNQETIAIKTAIFSVTDKTGLETLALGLTQITPELSIIASGGTAKTLAAAGINYIPLEQYTGFPECFSGRVKTLHPHVAGGILMRREEDHQEAESLGISAIDLVVCNLYRFDQALKKGTLSMDELIEFMDIGGSTLIRSAVKNYRHVAIIVDPADYPSILDEIKTNDGKLSIETRKRLAVKAIQLSANYENLLAEALSERIGNETLHRPRLGKGRKLRYGENPDQQGWVYPFEGESGLAQAEILSGKEPSYNNYEDATEAYKAACQLKSLGIDCGVAIIKHGSLCGYATGPDASEAFLRAWAGDEKSAFGSVIAFTCKVPSTIIDQLDKKFIEVMIAPEFDDAFVKWAHEKKPNLRLIKAPSPSNEPYVYKKVSGGMLVQTAKTPMNKDFMMRLIEKAPEGSSNRIGIVTKKEADKQKAFHYAFSVAAVNFAKSNAIAITREYQPGFFQLLGIGAGQPNRVDSLQRLAIPKALENLKAENRDETALVNCVLASDGFFPFDDSIRYAGKWIKTCIQPGGSIKDQEVIDAADEMDICMIFTGERYFTH